MLVFVHRSIFLSVLHPHPRTCQVQNHLPHRLRLSTFRIRSLSFWPELSCQFVSFLLQSRTRVTSAATCSFDARTIWAQTLQVSRLPLGREEASSYLGSVLHRAGELRW